MNISESLLAQGDNVSERTKLTNIFNKLILLRNATNNYSSIIEIKMLDGKKFRIIFFLIGTRESKKVGIKQ